MWIGKLTMVLEKTNNLTEKIKSFTYYILYITQQPCSTKFVRYTEKNNNMVFSSQQSQFNRQNH